LAHLVQCYIIDCLSTFLNMENRYNCPDGMQKFYLPMVPPYHAVPILFSFQQIFYMDCGITRKSLLYENIYLFSTCEIMT